MQWAALICTFLSIYLMGRKLLLGPVIGVLGSVFWLVYGLTLNDLALILTNTGIGLLSMRTVWLWYNEPRSKVMA